jgi:hypothetical protein
MLSLSQLYQRIAGAEESLRQQIRMLRQIKKIDPEAYRRRKGVLPWFIGARFRDNLRRAEHFEHLDFFVLDFDGCFHNGDQISNLKARLRQDEQLALAYVSPGGEGLKCVFRLATPLPNTKWYADFYRAFALGFARRYGLEASIDLKTHDVTRVSFVSDDPEALLNEQAQAVDWKPYLPEQLPLPEEPTPSAEEPKADQGLDEDVLRSIRQKLRPGKARPPRKPAYVPEALHEVVEPIRKAAAELGIQTEEIRDIQYGKKFRFVYKHLKAEINVFFLVEMATRWWSLPSVERMRSYLA